MTCCLAVAGVGATIKMLNPLLRCPREGRSVPEAEIASSCGTRCHRIPHARHNQPLVNPARRSPVTTYGHARISPHNISDR